MGILATSSSGEGDDPSAVGLGHRTLRALHLDLLGRSPYRAERELWHGGVVGELVESILEGVECWEHWLEEQLYYFLLIDNFRPQSDSVRSLPEALADRRLDVRTALHRIALSPNFDQRNPGADTFVTVVMEQLLGIEVQRTPRELEIGKRVYDGHPGTFLGVRGSSQADVIRIAIEDERFFTRLLEREHERLLRVLPERRALKTWCIELDRDPSAYTNLIRSWLLSDAYRARLATRRELSNRTFVRSLFVDLFDRLPDQEEVRRLGGALDGLSDAGPLRSTLVRILLDSGQVSIPDREELPSRRAWIADLFPRFLGRAASAHELDTFAESFKDPACRSETVLYAILSHTEYATY